MHHLIDPAANSEAQKQRNPVKLRERVTFRGKERIMETQQDKMKTSVDYGMLST